VTLFYIKRLIKKHNIRIIIFAVLVLSMLMQSACKQLFTGASASEAQQPSMVSPIPDTTLEPFAVQQDSDTETPPAASSAAPSTETTNVAVSDVPESAAVPDDYFSDAAFMGNSLMDGFRLFSGLSTCDYYAATSMTVTGADSKNCVKLNNGTTGTLVDGLTQKPYGKIYILLGINEIGSNVDTFIGLYGKMLDKIIAAQPNCKIYILSITPVSEQKSDSSDIFNMNHINKFNTALRQLAANKGCYYLDLVTALAGSDGYLPASVTSDGVHFAAPEYKVMLNYIRTHYI